MTTDDGHVSPFNECQAIIAAQEADVTALSAILAQMLPGEIRNLRIAAGRLDEACREALRTRT